MLHTSTVVQRGAAAAAGAAEAGAASLSYRHQEKLRLYRSLLKGAHAFPMRSRRDVVTEEVRSTFRDPNNEQLCEKDVDYRLLLGWERAKSIHTYAENMHWFHSRDEVTKGMMHFSEERDRKRAAEMHRFNQVGDIRRKTEEVTEFKSTYYHVHPDYHSKIGQQPLTHSRDVWRARGQYGSDVGGPRQKFFVRRFKAMFPQGW
ncbi:Complex1 LYR-like/Complex 1 protein (LYR family) [Novymonas esmeraldas]|uniref:Complex1 LYR-like/Complex 1 protein (LYR family) n=1 Tax=Novymonas esmeraldas TaxID=1808958 RepID=A0AAW0EX54_9TRYP